VLQAIEAAPLLAMDTETTGLPWHAHRARLAQIAVSAGEVFILDLFELPADAVRPVFEKLSDKHVIMHNAAFDSLMAAPLGMRPGNGLDTALLSQLLYGPPEKKNKKDKFHSLKTVVDRELGWFLPKEEQESDWSVKELTRSQLVYAARDASVLMPLYNALT